MTDIVEQLRSYADDAADIGAADEAIIISRAADEIEWLRGERNRLAADLAKAHRDIIPWIEKAGAAAPTQDASKVTVSRDLVDSVLADAETWVIGHYFTDGEIHPALRHKYIRDMEDIWKLQAEMGVTKGE
jgi:hypothetical protein